MIQILIRVTGFFEDVFTRLHLAALRLLAKQAQADLQAAIDTVSQEEAELDSLKFALNEARKNVVEARANVIEQRRATTNQVAAANAKADIVRTGATVG